jgi:branched-chain amino acid transport system ATP-binding protein
MTAAAIPSAGTPALQVAGLQAYYGETHILHGVDFSVEPGQVVCLLGRNGSGRTTTLKSVLGLVGRRSGSVRVFGQETIAQPTERIARLGIGYCPEERGIFSSLSAEENLLLPPTIAEGGMSLAEIYEMFPNLKERRKSQGTRLSGGEQQMLALGRILRTGARLLLLDEITEGLAPVIVEALGKAIERLKARGLTLVMVEQNFRFVEALADRYYVIEHGRVIDTVARDELASKAAAIERHLGV